MQKMKQQQDEQVLSTLAAPTARREPRSAEDLAFLDNYPVGCCDNNCRPDQALCLPFVYLCIPWICCHPLHHCAMCGCTPCVRCMLGCGANPNSKLRCWFDGDPMGWASGFSGGAPFRKNKSGNDSLSDARRERHVHVVRFLSAWERHTRAIKVPDDVKTSHSMRQWLLEQRAKRPNGGPRRDQAERVTWFKSMGWEAKWPLHYAAITGAPPAQLTACVLGHSKEMKQHLLVGDDDPAGDALFMIAAMISKHLASNKEENDFKSTSSRDPNEKLTDWYDSEPLGWAAAFGQLHSVIDLILLGAEPDRPPNEEGHTPCSEAARERHEHVVQFLDDYQSELERQTTRLQEMLKKQGGPRFVVDEAPGGGACCSSVSSSTATTPSNSSASAARSVGGNKNYTHYKNTGRGTLSRTGPSCSKKDLDGHIPQDSHLTTSKKNKSWDLVQDHQSSDMLHKHMISNQHESRSKRQVRTNSSGGTSKSSTSRTDNYGPYRGPPGHASYIRTSSFEAPLVRGAPIQQKMASAPPQFFASAFAPLTSSAKGNEEIKRPFRDRDRVPPKGGEVERRLSSFADGESWTKC